MKPVQIKGGRKLSAFIKPMTATLSDQPAFDHKDWLFEIKWDGYRAIAEVGSSTRFYSRNGIAFDKAYPKIYKELEKIKIDAVIDGEIVVFDESGNQISRSFKIIQLTNHYPFNTWCLIVSQSRERIFLKSPLIERKEILKEILPKNSIVLYCDHVLVENPEKLTT